MRVRDIIHRDGHRLRLHLAAGEVGFAPLIRLSNPESATSTILLDLYGADVLAAFLMSARVSAVGELADECCNGDYPVTFQLKARGGDVRVELVQLDGRLVLSRALWDRLYTELQLTLAHGRQLVIGATQPGIVWHEQRRLLH